jgi:hypothetical protein
MKARIKATGEIVDIAEYSTIYAENYDTCFYPNELEFLDNSEDYWTRLEHTYAGMAMQGLMTILPNIGGMEGRTPKDEIIDIATETAHALVEKLKEKEERK